LNARFLGRSRSNAFLVPDSVRRTAAVSGLIVATVGPISASSTGVNGFLLAANAGPGDVIGEE
jgi:hypothetical protein